MIKFAILFLLLVASVKAEDLAFFKKALGEAPEGYSWTLCHDGFLALRKPKDWFLKEEGPSAKGTMACFITKEEITTKSDYSTGFTINILPQFHKKSGEQPSHYAKRFLARMAKETKETGGKIDKFFESTNGPLQSIVLRTTRLLPDKEGKNSTNTTVHHFLISNDNTSTLYISSFESPASEWNEAWKTGEKIVEQLGIISSK